MEPHFKPRGLLNLLPNFFSRLQIFNSNKKRRVLVFSSQAGYFQKGYLFLVLGLIIFLALTVIYFFKISSPLANEPRRVEFQVKKGMGLDEISNSLWQNSLIRSRAIFKIYSFLVGKASRFQPGIFDLSPTMSIPQIIDALAVSGRNEKAINILEGSTLKDIDTFLAEAQILEKNALINFSVKKVAEKYPFLTQVSSLEGFLFPDTYRFKIDSTVDEVVEKFLANFQEKAWPLLQNRKDWYHYLILASFLEREVPNFDDRRIVAGILLKRLTHKIPLQIDATISYAKCQGRLKTCVNPQIEKNDLTINSPFNTYQNLGWTPTPIANAGLSALKASLNPQASHYWYYLSAKNGQTIFSDDLETHNLRRSQYL